MDIVDEQKYRGLVKDNNVNYIVHLAGILSAAGEKNPDLAIDVNVYGAVNGLRIARDLDCRIFLPSSIAAFGGDKFPKEQTPVETILQPTTIYGKTKVFNEMLGEYFCNKFGVDFRCMRYPGVVSSEKFAFNGTACYSTEIFFHILENKKYYKCWLKEDAKLPMIYIDDCVEATMMLLRADSKSLTRCTYNLAGISFTPLELANAIKQIIPGAKIDFEPDFRQKIAETWPKSLNDDHSQRDWGWMYNISVLDLAKKTLAGIDAKYKKDL